MSNLEERLSELVLWMEERKITMQTLADAMGVSRAFVSTMLHRETMPAKRHRQLIILGFPDHVLPEPYNGPMGRPRKHILLQPQTTHAEA